MGFLSKGCAIAGLVLLALSQSMSGWAKPPSSEHWQLTFEEEFSGNKLDTTKWNTSYWFGRTVPTNQEAEVYMDDALSVKDGKLVITAKKVQDPHFPYTSGMITSMNKFTQTYGYFEMRAQLPAGRGFWPAFWLVPQDKDTPPEIDIMEALGHEPNRVHMTYHYIANNAHQSAGTQFTGPDFSKAMHTFAVAWRPGKITWYVDGVPHFSTEKGVAAKPMYIIVNLAVGGRWPGYPEATTPFPSTMLIDYIRVYHQK